jgi:transposase-like protein
MPLLFESGRMNSMPKKIDPALRERAVRLVTEHQQEYSSLTAASEAVARQLGVGKESVRRWVVQAQIDDGERPGVTTEENEEIKRLRAENRRLREDVAILKAATTFFAGGAVRHEALGISRGGERPSPLGRRSGLRKHRGSRSPGTTVSGGKRPREGEPCRYCQTVRACRARSEGAAQANQCQTLRNREAGSNLVDMGRYAVHEPERVGFDSEAV